MKIGIMSDTHNHIANTRWALSIFEKQGVEQILHCGDITTPSVIEILINTPVKFALGNMDYAEDGLVASVAHLFSPNTLAESHSLVLNETRIAFCHGHINRQLGQFIYSGLYQYVFHGHTHLRRDMHVGATRVINPGALGGNHKETRSVCVLDIDSNQAEFIMLPE
jgi:hypothetical protein